MKRTVLILAAICYSALGFSQGFNQGTIVAGFNMGVPHLYRGIVKIGTGSNVFKSKFNDRIEVSEVTGMFPILFRAEYGINKYFGLIKIISMIFTLLVNFFWQKKKQVKKFYIY